MSPSKWAWDTLENHLKDQGAGRIHSNVTPVTEGFLQSQPHTVAIDFSSLALFPCRADPSTKLPLSSEGSSVLGWARQEEDEKLTHGSCSSPRCICPGDAELRYVNAVKCLIWSYVGCSRNDSCEANFWFHCVEHYGGRHKNTPEMESSTLLLW